MDRYSHWINGARTAPVSGAYLPTLDPMTTQAWAEIARGDAADVEARATFVRRFHELNVIAPETTLAIGRRFQSLVRGVTGVNEAAVRFDPSG